MSGEWIFLEIARLVLSLALVYLAYLFGLRSQKIQALREYITETVKDEYPALYQEMMRNSESLDTYLENPNAVSFDFPVLSQIYDTGLDGFMKKHHRDLHTLVDSFHRNILPKFHKLRVRELMDGLFDVFSLHLQESLPKVFADTSSKIAVDLTKSINVNYIITDLLNERDEEVRKKIERCIIQETSHIRSQKAKRPFVIRGQTDTIYYEKIFESLLEKAKPEASRLVDSHRKLKELNDKEVKKKLLPLLQKYISDPI